MKIEIKITNWDTLNLARKDIKSASWIRLQGDFFEDPDLADLSNEAKLAWIYILCRAVKRLDGSARINTKQLAIAIQTENGTALLEELEKDNFITILESHERARTHTALDGRARESTSTTVPADVRYGEDGEDGDKIRGEDGEVSGEEHHSDSGESIDTFTEVEIIEPDKVTKAKSTKKNKSIEPTTQEDAALADKWLEHAKENKAGKKYPSSWTRAKFAQEIAKAKRLAGLTDQDMALALGHISTQKEGDFWEKHGLTPIGLDKIWKNGVRKIESCLGDLKSNPQYREAKLYQDISSPEWEEKIRKQEEICGF